MQPDQVPTTGPHTIAADSTAAADSTSEPRARRDHFLRLMFFEPSERPAAAPVPEGTPSPQPPPRGFEPLPELPLKGAATFHLPDPTMATRVSADSAAIEVMTDLRRVAAATIDRFSSLDDANLTMIRHGVRSLFVVDDRRLIGVITASDILGEKAVQTAQRRGIRHDEVMVRDLMTPAERLEVIGLDHVLAAMVGDVVATLKRSRRQHALVVDRGPDGEPMVRGIFSLTQIARQMGIVPHPPEIGRTFAEIEAAIGP